MKNLVKYLCFAFAFVALYSCTNQEDLEVNPDKNSLTEYDLIFSDEVKELPIFSLFQISQLILEGDDITEANRVKISILVKEMESDFRYLQTEVDTKKKNTTSSRSCGSCTSSYESCVWWAKSWDVMLQRCNAGLTSQILCDELREDYLENLDEIQATYIKCSSSFNKCIKQCSNKPPGNPGEEPM
jgi:hypothetical protein